MTDRVKARGGSVRDEKIIQWKIIHAPPCYANTNFLLTLTKSIIAQHPLQSGTPICFKGMEEAMPGRNAGQGQSIAGRTRDQEAVLNENAIYTLCMLLIEFIRPREAAISRSCQCLQVLGANRGKRSDVP